MVLSRRTFMTGATGAALSLELAGCAALTKPLSAGCPLQANAAKPLTIDAHVHLFNGSDFPVGPHLKYVKHIPVISDILDQMSWSMIPTASEEIHELDKLTGLFETCDKARIDAAAARHAQQQYQRGREELRRATRHALRGRSHRDIAAIIESLPASHSAYRPGLLPTRLASKRTFDIRGIVDLVLLMFQYRYVILNEYLAHFSRTPEREVDLIVAHIVDYDYPEAGGKQSPSPIPHQIDLMSRLSVLTAGRVHYYAPFDPMKQVAKDAGFFDSYDPLEIVRDAVENKGCLGVKLYPVMGFKPYGNSGKQTSFWKTKWFSSDLLSLPDFGRRLDDSLARLYRWCIDNDVPIMAHTSPSNCPQEGHDAKFCEMTEPDAWAKTLAAFPGLRVNFGHFGGYGESAEKMERVRAFARLMDVDGPGRLAYADTAYYPEIVDDPAHVRERLRGLYRNHNGNSGANQAALAQRLMYATDWHMLVAKGKNSYAYLGEFIRQFNVLDEDKTLGAQGRLSERYFGLNAADYLGLHEGQANRIRLQTFYLAHGVSDAPLLAKVDAAAKRVAAQ